MVTPVAKFKSTSSRTKIFHLVVLYSNLKSICKFRLQILLAQTRILKLLNLVSKFAKIYECGKFYFA